MAHLHMKHTCSPRLVKQYWLSRVARVIPLYLVANLAMCSYLNDWSWKQLPFVRSQAHLWTVNIELRFYLVFVPLWLLHTHRLHFTLALVAMLTYAAPLYNPSLRICHHFGAFACGSALACGGAVETVNCSETSKIQKICSVPAFLAIVSGFTMQGFLPASVLPASDAMAVVVKDICLCLFLTCAAADLNITCLFASTILQALGTISYGIYIIHPFVFAIAHQLYGGGIWQFVCSSVLVLMIATLSFHAFERRVGELIRSTQMGHLISTAVATCILVGGIKVYLFPTNTHINMDPWCRQHFLNVVRNASNSGLKF